MTEIQTERSHHADSYPSDGVSEEKDKKETGKPGSKVGVHDQGTTENAGVDFVELAKGDDAQNDFAMALLGKDYNSLSDEEKAMINTLISDLLAGKITVVVEDEDSDYQLEDGVDGAFIPGENGAPGTIVIAAGLTDSERAAALKEEFGEAVASYAEGLGLVLADGDAGARLVIFAEGGSVSMDSDLFDTSESDVTTVTINVDGKEVEVEAKARATTDADAITSLEAMEDVLESATGVTHTINEDGSYSISGTNAAGEEFEYTIIPSRDDNNNSTITVVSTVYEDGVAYELAETFVVTGEGEINDFITDFNLILTSLGLEKLVFHPDESSFTFETAVETEALTLIEDMLADATYVSVTRLDDGSLRITGFNPDGSSFKIRMSITVGADGSVTMKVNIWETSSSGVTTPVLLDTIVSGGGSITSFLNQVNAAPTAEGFVPVHADLETGFFSRETASVDEILSNTESNFNAYDTTVVYEDNGDVTIKSDLGNGSFLVVTYSSSTDVNGEKIVTVSETIQDENGTITGIVSAERTVVGEANTEAVNNKLNTILAANGAEKTTFLYPSVSGHIDDILNWDVIAAKHGLFNDAGALTHEYHDDGSFSITYTNSDNSTYTVTYVPGEDADGNLYVDVSYTYTDAQGNVTSGANMSDPDGPSSTRIMMGTSEALDELMSSINETLAAEDPDFTIPVAYFGRAGFGEANTNLGAFNGALERIENWYAGSTNVKGGVNENGDYVLMGEKDGKRWSITVTVVVNGDGQKSIQIKAVRETGVETDGVPETEVAFNIFANGDDFMPAFDSFNAKMTELFPSFKPKYWSETEQSIKSITDDTVVSYGGAVQTEHLIDENTENGTVVAEIYLIIDGERVAYSSLPAEVRAQFNIELTGGGGAFGLNEQGQVVVVVKELLVPGEMNLDFKITADGISAVDFGDGDAVFAEPMTFEVLEGTSATDDPAANDALDAIAKHIGDGTIDDIVIDDDGNMIISGTTAEGNAYTITLTTGVSVDGEPTLTMTGTIDHPVDGTVEMFTPVTVTGTDSVDGVLDHLNAIFISHPETPQYSEHDFFQIEIDPVTNGIVTKDPASGYSGPYGTESGYGNDHSTYGIPPDAEIVSVISVPAGTGAFGDHEVEIVTYVDPETGETVTAAVDVGVGSETYGYVLVASVKDTDGNVTVYDHTGAVTAEMSAEEIANGGVPDGVVAVSPGHNPQIAEDSVAELNDALAALGVSAEDVVETGVVGPMAYVTYRDPETGQLKTSYIWADTETGQTFAGTVTAGTVEGDVVEEAIKDYKTAYGSHAVVDGAVGVGAFVGVGYGASVFAGLGEAAAVTAGAVMGAAASVAVGLVFAVAILGAYAGYLMYHASQGHDLMRSVIDGDPKPTHPTLTGHFEVTSGDIVTPPSDEAPAEVAEEPVERTPEEVKADEALEDAEASRERAQECVEDAEEATRYAEEKATEAHEARRLANENPDDVALQQAADEAEAEAATAAAKADEANDLATEMLEIAVGYSDEALEAAEAAAGDVTSEELLNDPRYKAALDMVNSTYAAYCYNYDRVVAYQAEIIALEAETSALEAESLAAEPGATDAQKETAQELRAEADTARTNADDYAFLEEVAEIEYLDMRRKSAMSYATRARAIANQKEQEYLFKEQQAESAVGTPQEAEARADADAAKADAFAADQEANVAEVNLEQANDDYDEAVSVASERTQAAFRYQPTYSSSGEIDTGYSAYGLPADAVVTSSRFAPGYDSVGGGEFGDHDAMVYEYTRASEPGVTYTSVIDVDPESATYGFVIASARYEEGVGMTVYGADGQVIGTLTQEEIDEMNAEAMAEDDLNDNGRRKAAVNLPQTQYAAVEELSQFIPAIGGGAGGGFDGESAGGLTYVYYYVEVTDPESGKKTQEKRMLVKWVDGDTTYYATYSEKDHPAEIAKIKQAMALYKKAYRGVVPVGGSVVGLIGTGIGIDFAVEADSDLALNGGIGGLTVGLAVLGWAAVYRYRKAQQARASLLPIFGGTTPVAPHLHGRSTYTPPTITRAPRPGPIVAPPPAPVPAVDVPAPAATTTNMIDAGTQTEEAEAETQAIQTELEEKESEADEAEEKKEETKTAEEEATAASDAADEKLADAESEYSEDPSSENEALVEEARSDAEEAEKEEEEAGDEAAAAEVESEAADEAVEEVRSEFVAAMEEEIALLAEEIARAQAVLDDPDASEADKTIAAATKDRAEKRKTLLEARIVIERALLAGEPITENMESDFFTAEAEYLASDIAYHKAEMDYFQSQYHSLANKSKNEELTEEETMELEAWMHEYRKAAAKHEAAEAALDNWSASKPPAW